MLHQREAARHHRGGEGRAAARGGAAGGGLPRVRTIGGLGAEIGDPDPFSRCRQAVIGRDAAAVGEIADQAVLPAYGHDADGMAQQFRDAGGRAGQHFDGDRVHLAPDALGGGIVAIARVPVSGGPDEDDLVFGALLRHREKHRA